ncbi:hypothetical protein C8R43DRAFT_873165, partial [Mycena crocata]
VAFTIAASVAFAIVVWEYATLLPDEIRLYRKPVWGTVPPYAFLALRYGGILATVPTIFLSATKSNNCQATASFSQGGVVLVVTSSATIFTFRTSLLWANNRVVRAALGSLLVTMVVCWVAAATQYRAVSIPDPAFRSNCRVLPTVPWLPLTNALSSAFFITALILTLLKLQYHHPRDSLIASRIYRANLGYHIGTTLTAATALVLQALSPPSNALALSTASIATVLTVAFGTRAFRNLMLAQVLDNERAHGLPYPSTSPIISHANEKRYAHPPPPPTTPLPPHPRPPRSAVARNGPTSRPNTAQSSRPNTAQSSRPNTAQSSQPNTGQSSRPQTGDDSSTAHLVNPHTTFPSPPNSCTGHSVLSGSPSSQSPLLNSYSNRSVLSGTSPTSLRSPLSNSSLRRDRGPLAEMPESPKSGWSDS